MIFIHLTFLICNLSLADTYRLSPYDTIELEIINHSEFKTKQAVTPDGLLSLPILGMISVEGYTLTELQDYLNHNYAAYLKNPQILLKLTPKPIYIIQYDRKKETWEVKEAKSVEEAQALIGIPTSDLGLRTSDLAYGNVYKVSVGRQPDFIEDNWYKIIAAVAIAAGTYATLNK